MGHASYPVVGAVTFDTETMLVATSSAFGGKCVDAGHHVAWPWS